MKLGKKMVLFSMGIVAAAMMLQNSAVSSMLNDMRTLTSENYTSMKEGVSQDALNGLVSEAEVNLCEKSTHEMGDLDSTFSQYHNAVMILADMAEDVFTDTDVYQEVDVPASVETSGGTWELTVRTESDETDTEDPDIKHQLGLIANLSGLMCRIGGGIMPYRSLCIALDCGVMLQADPGDVENVQTGSIDFKNRNWYQQALSENTASFLVNRDPEDNTLRMYYSEPILLDDQCIGVAAAEIDTGDLADTFASIAEGTEYDSCKECIFTGEGDIVYTNIPMRVLPLQEGEERMDLDRLQEIYKECNGTGFDLQNPQTGYFLIDAGENTRELCILTVSKQNDWILLAATDYQNLSNAAEDLYDSMDEKFREAEDKFDAGMADTTRAITFYCITILLIALVLTILLGRSVSRPIRELTEKVRGIDGDHLNFTWKRKAKDETAVLAGAFDTMVKTIRVYMDHVKRQTAETEKMESEMRIATQVQLGVLPQLTEEFCGRREFTLFADTIPAREVGGDFYDFFWLDETHLALVMADVSGKGVPAALFMVAAKQRIHSALQMQLSPAEVLAHVNDKLCKNNPAEMFVTAWVGIADVTTGHVVAANAGHEYPMVSDSKGIYQLLRDSHGFVLGGEPGMLYRDYEIDIPEGGALFLYTDGVSEAENSRHDMFGLEKTLQSLNRNTAEDPDRVIGHLFEDIRTYVDGAPQFDDITMLLWARTGKKDTEAETGVGSGEGEAPMLTIRVEAVPEHLHAVQEQLTEFMIPAGCSNRMQMQVQVIIEELFVNVASYAYARQEKPGQVEIRAEILRDSGMLSICMIDQGLAYDPLAQEAPDVTLDAKQRPIGGLGIFMVRNMVDDITYRRENDSNILTFFKKIG